MPASAQRLFQADLPAIEHHLIQLPADDRAQRFGHFVSDELVRDYVSGLEFEQDAHFGIFDEFGDKLLAYAHLAIAYVETTSELGISVIPPARRRGLGSILLQRSILHARNTGMTVLELHYQPYNTALIELARKSGMLLYVERGDGLARLIQPAADWKSLGEEASQTLGDGALRGVQRLARASLVISNDWRAVADLSP